MEMGELRSQHNLQSSSPRGVRFTRIRTHSGRLQGAMRIELHGTSEGDDADDLRAVIALVQVHVDLDSGEARRIPDVGQSFIFHGFRFDILERQRHQITRVRITPPVGDMNGE